MGRHRCDIIFEATIMAPIPTETYRSEKPSILLVQELPVHNQAGSPRSPKLSAMKLIASIFLFLATVSLLHKPLNHCYRKARTHCSGLSVDERARNVLAGTPLIDGHIDMAMLIRGIYENKIDNDEWRDAFENGQLAGDADIARLREGMSGGAFWSVWSPCPKNGTDFSDEYNAKNVQFTLDQIDLMARIHDMYPDVFSRAAGLHAVDALHEWEEGRFISPLGIEGLHQIANKASNLRRFHDMGVRYATLTHNCH